MAAARNELSLVLHGGNALVSPTGAPIRLTTKHTLLLLVVIADQEGHRLSRRMLAQTIWPKSSDQSARASLRTALSQLRRVLPEPGLLSDTDYVELCPGFVVRTTSPSDGEFMPDFDDDWVIERRIRDRDEAVSNLIVEAKTSLVGGDGQRALELAEKAAKLDPWSREAVALRVEILESQGSTANAAEVSRTFRRRMLRDFGTVVSAELSGEAPKSPLVQTGEWLVDRDPAEAAAFLVATAQHWEIAPPQEALELHLRVLDRIDRSTPQRSQVESQALYLQWCLSGICNDLSPVQEALEDAIRERDLVCAHRLTRILTYGCLSSGQFAKALSLGKELVAMAHDAGRSDIMFEAEMTYGIIHFHAGDPSLSLGLMRRVGEGAEDSSSLVDAAQKYLVDAHVRLMDGDLTGCHETLHKARTAFRASSGDRLLAYTDILEAELMDACGESFRSRELLCRVRKAGAEVIGHSAMAMAGERIAEIDCRLGEFDLSAESLTDAQAFRIALGTVASPHERRRIAPVKQTLLEKLGDARLRQMARKNTNG